MIIFRWRSISCRRGSGDSRSGEAQEALDAAAWRRNSTAIRLTQPLSGSRSCNCEQTPALLAGTLLPLDLVVLAAVDLLGELDAERTRVCRGHDCGWLFVDSSKSGRRVWCDMGTCGNASKGERFARAQRRRKT